MKAIDFGCRIFYFGGYGEFDALCYKIAKKLQEEKNELDIKLIYCVSMEKYSKKQKNKIIVNLYKTL